MRSIKFSTKTRSTKRGSKFHDECSSIFAKEKAIGFDKDEKSLISKIQTLSSIWNVKIPGLAIGSLQESICFSNISNLANLQHITQPVIERAVRAKLDLSIETVIPYDIEWFSFQRVRFCATPDAGISIGVAYDKNYIVCAVGERDQGLSLSSIRHVDREEWTSIQRSCKSNVFCDLLTLDSSLDMTGIRLHCAIEAMNSFTHDSSCGIISDLRLSESDGGCFFNFQINRNEHWIWTVPLVFKDGITRIFAIVLESQPSKSNSSMAA